MKLYDIYGKIDHDGLWEIEPDPKYKIGRREADLRDLAHDNFRIQVRRDCLEALQEFHPNSAIGQATRFAYEAMKRGDKIPVIVGSKTVVVGSRVVHKNKFAYYPSDAVFSGNVETAKLLIGGCPNKYIFELVEQSTEEEPEVSSKRLPGVNSRSKKKK